MGGDIWDVQEMIVVPVTDKNCHSTIGRSGKQPFYHRRVRRDARSTSQPLESIGPPPGKTWIAKEWRGQESVVSALDENPGDTQVRDGNGLARIPTTSCLAADGVRGGDDLLPDNVGTSAPRHSEQRAGLSYKLEPGGVSH
jgi:hypothetical protein